MANNDNKLLGSCETRPNNFGGVETRIGLTRSDLEYLTENLNEKGWVNITLKTSKAGKPYLEHWAGAKGAPRKQEAAGAATESNDGLPF